MGTCAVCDKDVLIEDLYECEDCHKKCCPDHITNRGNRLDDPKYICTECLEEKE